MKGLNMLTRYEAQRLRRKPRGTFMREAVFLAWAAFVFVGLALILRG